MNTAEFVEAARKGKIDVGKNAQKAFTRLSELEDYNYITTVADYEPPKTGRLYGLPVSVKDALCVKGLETTAGSTILQGYKPVFDATIVKKIKEEGGILLGKTSQDEFGFGSFNVNTKQVPKNPYDKNRATGGSSGGAAGLTRKMEMPHVAIAESTGGSIACPASYCGVYGLTPTYGLVSRYGLIDYSNSMDKIGIMSIDIEGIELMLDVIAGYDEMDSTSAKSRSKKKGKRIAVVTESLDVDPKVKDNLLKNLKYEQISLPLTFKYGLQVYYLISMAEASTNLSKLCGMRYGKHEELEGDFNQYFTEVRSKHFSKEAKRRIFLGTYARMSGFRDAYYIKALKARTRIIEEYKKAFEKYDLIITPTMPNIAPRFSEIKKMTPLENYMMDMLTVGPNLAGFPHLSIPSGFSEGMPTGMMVIADHFNEKGLIEFARSL